MNESNAGQSLPPEDARILAQLVHAARPFLRINGADRVDWRRVIKDEKNGRNGPWKWLARLEVVDADIWSRSGEVLYLVTDGNGIVRAVGQSKNRLKDRWKLVPMFSIYNAVSLNQHGLFHTTGWRAIERELDLGHDTIYTVSAIFRDELQQLCQRLGGPLSDVLSQPETDRYKLSYHVETWVCKLKLKGVPLWNLQKTGESSSYMAKRSRRKRTSISA